MSESDKPRLRVCVLDDNEIDRASVTSLLSKVGDWNVETDEIEAWESLWESGKPRAFDLLFVDYHLGMDTGTEVIQRIRSTGDDRPIIVLTGVGDERIAAEISREGADEYLIKDTISEDMLRTAIYRALERYRIRSDRREASKLLIQSQRMDTVSTLASGIVHDFSNILTGVLGYVELAKSRSRDAKLETYLGRVETGATEMARLLEHLSICCNAGGAITSPMSIRQMMRSLTLLARHWLPGNGDLSTQICEDDQLPIMGDYSSLQQSIINIIVNASESMEHTGSVDIRVRRVERKDLEGVPERVSGAVQYAAIEVSDSGPGVPKDMRNRIFEPYYSTKRNHSDRGAGLGLAVAWNAMEAHSGWISVGDRDGGGAVFTLYLPLIDVRSEISENMETIKANAFVNGVFSGSSEGHGRQIA